MAEESGRVQLSNHRELKRASDLLMRIENRRYLDAIRVAYTEARQILDNLFRALPTIFNAINLRFPAGRSRLVSQRVQLSPVIIKR